LLIAASALGAGSSTTATGSSTSWKTYSYDNAKISVPANWNVIRHGSCPTMVEHGTLILGLLPKQIVGCALDDYTKNLVTLTSLPLSYVPGDVCLTAVVVNQLSETETCNANGTLGTVFVDVPSLQVEASGSGPGASRVLHTLSRI
jgi:hypothetical protein